MATLTLKNVPGPLYERLKESARWHRRSINSEAIVCLEQSLLRTRVDPEAWLERARRLRERLSGVVLTEQDLKLAREQGRP